MSGDKDSQADSSVFITVRYLNKTMFLQFLETNTIKELKAQVEKLLDYSADDMRIHNFNTDEALDDGKSLHKCGIKGDCAMAYKPFELYMTLQQDEFQKRVQDYSDPPELPDVMKPATDVDK